MVVKLKANYEMVVKQGPKTWASSLWGFFGETELKANYEMVVIQAT